LFAIVSVDLPLGWEFDITEQLHANTHSLSPHQQAKKCYTRLLSLAPGSHSLEFACIDGGQWGKFIIDPLFGGKQEEEAQSNGLIWAAPKWSVLAPGSRRLQSAVPSDVHTHQSAYFVGCLLHLHINSRTQATATQPKVSCNERNTTPTRDHHLVQASPARRLVLYPSPFNAVVKDRTP